MFQVLKDEFGNQPSLYCPAISQPIRKNSFAERFGVERCVASAMAAFNVACRNGR